MEFEHHIAILESTVRSLKEIKNIDSSTNQINRKAENISENKLYIDKYEKYIAEVDNLARALKEYSAELNWQLIIIKSNIKNKY